MKRIVTVIGAVLLLLCFSFGVLGDSGITSPGPSGTYGFGPGGNNAGSDLGIPSNNPHIPGGPGGVHFQATAAAAGRAAGKNLGLSYDPKMPDGRRLFIRIEGFDRIQSGLYDWQLVPIAKYADSGFYSCITLLDDPQTEEEITFHIKVGGYNEKAPDDKECSLFWANLHPRLANTLIGFNALLVDEMFVFVGAGYNAVPAIYDAVYGPGALAPRGIPGYNDIPIDKPGKGEKRFHNNILVALSIFNGEGYVYTDYGTEITFDVRDKQIVFDGFPSYQFQEFIYDKSGDVVEVRTLDELNEYVKRNREAINALNPVVYRTAELTSHWSALFRAIKAQNPAGWSGFLKQIESAAVQPEMRTPRYWIPGYMPPELQGQLLWASANSGLRKSRRPRCLRQLNE
jgi:hypothetical protein